MRRFNIYLEDGSALELTEHNLSNSGGEGEIFIKEGFAYKIFFNQKKSIELKKIEELSKLDRYNIVRPIQAIFNEKNVQIGYQMKALSPDKCFPLTRFFTTDFRNQKGVTQDQVDHIIKEMYETFEFIHKKGCLIVDGNEMNFLLSDDFKTIYFIDVDSYKTPTFKPTAYNQNTLDPKIENEEFNKGSDWFIFAILFCQIMVGIHPFKGIYTGTSKIFGKKDIIKRMEMGVSIFNKKIKLNKAVRPIDIIPKKMKDWLEVIFMTSNRETPPMLANKISQILNQVDLFKVPDGFKVFEAGSFYSDMEKIKIFENDYIYRKEGFYYSSNGELLSSSENKIILVSGNIGFVKLNKNNEVEIFMPKLNIKQIVIENVENIYVFNDKLFIYKNNKISSIDIVISNNKLITGINTSWDLFIHQNVNEFILFYQSGKRMAYYFYEDNKNAIIELDKMIDKDEKIINIKGFENYIVIKTIKDNEYHSKIFNIDLFNKRTNKLYDEISFDISINFVLNKGLLIGDVMDSDLMICYYKNNEFKSKIIPNFNINKEFIIYNEKLSFIEKNKIYNLSMN